MLSTRIPVVCLATSLFLAGCNSGSYDPVDDSHDHEHEHTAALLFTDKNTPAITLYHAEEDAFELLGSAWGNAGELTLADNGLAVAILANGQSNFVLLPDEHDEAEHEGEADEEHAEPELLVLSLSASQVISSANHFVLLDDSLTSALLPVETLAEAEEAEETLELASQSHPAVVLDEEDGYFLLFADNQARVYQLVDGVLSPTPTGTACSNPENFAQQSEWVIFNCDEGVKYLALEGEGIFSVGSVSSELTLDSPRWMPAGHGFMALEDNQLLQLHTDEGPVIELAEVMQQGESVSLDAELCAIATEKETGEMLFVLNSHGVVSTLTLPEHDSEEESLELTGQLQLDESQLPMSCSDLYLQGAAESAVVVDNLLGKAYLIDAHDGPFHIHQRLNLPANLDVADFRVLQEIAVEGHSHEE